MQEVAVKYRVRWRGFEALRLDGTFKRARGERQSGAAGRTRVFLKRSQACALKHHSTFSSRVDIFLSFSKRRD